MRGFGYLPFESCDIYHSKVVINLQFLDVRGIWQRSDLLDLRIVELPGSLNAEQTNCKEATARISNLIVVSHKNYCHKRQKWVLLNTVMKTY